MLKSEMFCVLTCGMTDGRVVRIAFDVAQLNTAVENSVTSNQGLENSRESNKNDTNPFGPPTPQNVPNALVSRWSGNASSNFEKQQQQLDIGTGIFRIDVTSEWTIHRHAVIAVHQHVHDELAMPFFAQKGSQSSQRFSASLLEKTDGFPVREPKNYVAVDMVQLCFFSFMFIEWKNSQFC